MAPFEPLTDLQDMLTVRRVYGDPVDREGVTVVPVAMVAGGGGGGAGEGPDREGSGWGGGFGMGVRPLGFLEIRSGDVRFRPVVHPESLIRALAWLLVAVAVLGRARRR